MKNDEKCEPALGVDDDHSYLLQVVLVWPCLHLLGSWASTGKKKFQVIFKLKR